MRGFAVPALVATAIVAGCGGDGAASPSITEPDRSSTTAVTAAPASPSTTEPLGSAAVLPSTTIAPSPDPSTTVAGPDHRPGSRALLRPDGIGPVDLGTPADEAIARLTALLGPPDRIDVIEPGGEGCVELAGWLSCLRERRIVDAGRLAVWQDAGLEVALVDTTSGAGPRERAPLEFGEWHAVPPAGGAGLETEEGISTRMTVGELRRAAPGVEFTYNEGLLDSYYVTVAGGAYWGRLDWNPDTPAVEWGDIRAVQAALNDQGADLAVDGEWGPRSEAAWLEFLADQGIEPFTTWPWLTPEIGAALGLPPDDVTVATIEPRPPIDRPTSTPTSTPTLRSDGLGRFDFGAPADDLVPELEAVFGPPADDTSYTPDGPGRFDHLPLGYWAAYELRIVRWDDPGLRLVLSDVPFFGDHYGEPTPGTITLVSWATSSPRLAFSDGLAVGSSLGQLRAHHPDVEIGTFNICGTGYDPASFVTVPHDGDTPPLWRGFRGTLDWDWVSDLQRALNDRGASLAVDGEYGSRTRAAVQQFQLAEALDQFTAPDANGLIGPVTAEALGLRAPDDARITGLAAGSPGSC